MPKRRMLINADQPEVCRVVIIEDGKIEEYISEHATQELIKGNVYHGVITRVEPAIEAAFIDYGGKKFGFLPFKDVKKESYKQTGERKAKLRIQDVLFKGQKLLVQVVKEERDAKGPTLSNYITIPGRFLVIMNGSDSTGVSRKIEDEDERKNLKKILADLEVPENIGVIIRTAGLGRAKPELQKDLEMLLKVLDGIEASAKNTEAPSLLYRGPDMVVRTVRDHYTDDIDEILVDNVNAFNSIKEFFSLIMPHSQTRVTLHQDVKPLFSNHNIEEQIESIYCRRVPLPSGGSLVIDIGEALVSIDVNSGKTTNASELEETALRTNMEAAHEIGRQLRLRDQGGLVVIDFIDMSQKKNKTLVEKELKNAFKKDKARINISRISKFGLIEMSRQRMSSPSKEGVFERCRHCGGTGHLKSRAAISLNVIRKILDHLSIGKVKSLAVEVSNEIADYFLNHKMKYFIDLQEKYNFKIQFSCKEGLAYENFTYTILEKRDDRPVPQKPRHEKRPHSHESLTHSASEPNLDTGTQAQYMGDTLAMTESPANLETPAIEAVAEQSVYQRPVELQMTDASATLTPPPVKVDGRRDRPGRRGARGPQSKNDLRRRHPRRLPGKRGVPGKGRRWRTPNPNNPQVAGGTGEGAVNPIGNEGVVSYPADQGRNDSMPQIQSFEPRESHPISQDNQGLSAREESSS